MIDFTYTIGLLRLEYAHVMYQKRATEDDVRFREGMSDEYNKQLAELAAGIDLLRNAPRRLEKIEELMHPGYWSTYDERRRRILQVLESSKQEWTNDPYSNG